MYPLPFVNNPFPFPGLWWPVILLIVIAEVALKGVGLYRSARNGHKYWFIAILFINTLGILPLIYLVRFANKEKESPARSLVSPSRLRRGKRKK